MTTENELLDFDWENQEEDFFGIGEKPATPAPKEVKKVEEEKAPVTKTGKKAEEEVEEEEEEEEASFFEEETKDKEEEEEGDTKKPSGESSGEPGENYWEDVYKDFKENKLLRHVELEEGETLDAERLLELQEEDYEIEISERLKTWAQKDLDADAQAFIKFKTQGGNTADFFETYKNTSETPVGDIKEGSYQDSIIRYQLKKEGWDREEIEDRIEYLTSNGQKEKIAKRYEVKIQAEDTKSKEALLVSNEAKIKQAKLDEEEYNQSLQDVLESTVEVNGLKITPKDKAELFKFMTKKEYKVNDKKSVTGFQKKLAEVFKDSDKMILLAKLVNNDFDFTDFEKATKTKQTKQVKRNLEQRRTLRPSKTGSNTGSSLAELF